MGRKIDRIYNKFHALDREARQTRKGAEFRHDASVLGSVYIGYDSDRISITADVTLAGMDALHAWAHEMLDE